MAFFRCALWTLPIVVVALGCGDDVERSSGPNGAGGTGGGANCNCRQGAYVPVCGVDGTTYDATCGTACVPVDIACQGECPCTDCDALEMQYAAALADAKVCDPALSVAQCTASAGYDLPCGCPTFVNPDNDAAVAELDALKAEWMTSGCPMVDCDCGTPMGAICQPGGASGTCVDQP